MRRPNTPQVYAVIDRWKNAALLLDGSLFTPGSEVWSEARIDELYRHFNEQPDERLGPVRYAETADVTCQSWRLESGMASRVARR